MGSSDLSRSMKKPGRGLKFWTILFLAGLYGLSISGRQASPDEEIYFRMAENAFSRHTFVLEPPTTIPTGHHQLTGRDGRNYAIYGPGLMYLHVPLVALGGLIGPTFLGSLRTRNDFPFGEEPFLDANKRIVFSAAGTIAALLLAVVVFRVATYFGLPPEYALLAVLLIGLSTPIWAYVKTVFRDLPQTLFAFAGLGEGLRATRNRCPRRGLLAGMLLGLAFNAKEQGVIQFVLLCGWMLWQLGIPALLMTAAGFFAAALPAVSYKLLIEGTVTKMYGTSFFTYISTPLYIGLPGLLIAPGKGLLLFAPILLFAVPGLKRFWRERRDEAGFITVNLLSMLLIPAVWEYWHGGLAWGPRLLLPMIPWLGILSVYAIRKGSGAFQKTLFAIFLIFGVLVNLGGLSLNWHLYHVIEEYRAVLLQGKTNGEFYEALAFSPDNNIIMAGWRSLGIVPSKDAPPDILGKPIEKAWYHLGQSRDFLWWRAWKNSQPYYLAWSGLLLLLSIISGIRLLTIVREEASHC